MSQSLLEQSRLFFEYANEYATKHLSVDEVSFPDFLQNFEMPESAVQEFDKTALASDLIEITQEELDANRTYIRQVLKQEVAGNLWGMEARYRVYLQRDTTVAAAMAHFPEAKLMARLYEEALSNQR